MRTQRKLALLACLGAVGLSGCSYAPRDERAAYEPVSGAAAADHPMAQMPPEAGAVVAVLESKVSGVLTLRIVLAGDAANDGENSIVVKVDQSPKRPSDLDLAVPKPSEDGIARELDVGFPTIDMQISNSWNHNDFGPFGYAVGRSAKGSTCIYAWQYYSGPAPRVVEDPTARAAAASMPSAPTSIRARLCRKGLEEADIVALVQAMEISPPGGGDAYTDTTYASLDTTHAKDALQAAGAPRHFFTGARAREPEKKPAHKKIHHALARMERPHVQPTQQSAPASQVSRAVVVPLPAGSSPSPSPAAAAPSVIVNPLLAPLQGAAASRSLTTAEDLPLPGRLAPKPKVSSAEPSPVATLAPMPLPN